MTYNYVYLPRGIFNSRMNNGRSAASDVVIVDFNVDLIISVDTFVATGSVSSTAIDALTPHGVFGCDCINSDEFSNGDSHIILLLLIAYGFHEYDGESDECSNDQESNKRMMIKTKHSVDMLKLVTTIITSLTRQPFVNNVLCPRFFYEPPPSSIQASNRYHTYPPSI